MSFEVLQKGNCFEIWLDGRLFTTCVYATEYIRPFMGPVYASDGKPFTRFAPHHPKHPHQRSVFVGVGDVNGVDFWNEEGSGKGKMTLDTVLQATGGDTATVAVKLVWSSLETQKPILDEVRTLYFEQKPDCVAVQLHCAFTAAYGDVTFGETKEAGPMGIRVADAIRVDDGGTFVNSEGGINEDECWGKTAKWCNYYADIDGKKLGIAAYDSPQNPRYPTAWHIRDYGLMAANNLFFKGAEQIPAGETLHYDYLICFWEDEFDPAVYVK